MTADVSTAYDEDLHKPLTQRKTVLERVAPMLGAARFWFVRLGGSLLGIMALGLGVWVFVTDDPQGGRPIAEAPIATMDQSSSDAHSMLRPSTANDLAPGQPRILRVPSASPSEPASPDALVQSMSQTAAAGPRFEANGGLRALADPLLVQRFDSDSFIPVTGPAGERPLDVYARPLEAGTVAPGQPRIAIIFGGMALSQTLTQEAIDRLPPEVTLSFAPYGNSLSRWTQRARQAGHEYLIEIPMEPFDYPNNDPGPHTLLSSLEAEANLERMHWSLSRVSTPIGFINYMGGRFASDPNDLRPIVADAVQRGLLVLDDGRSARSQALAVAGSADPVLKADVVIDARTDEDSIGVRLAQLEGLARETGQAIGVASALPISLSMLEGWARTLEAKGIALVPVSSLARF